MLREGWWLNGEAGSFVFSRPVNACLPDRTKHSWRSSRAAAPRRQFLPRVADEAAPRVHEAERRGQLVRVRGEWLRRGRLVLLTSSAPAWPSLLPKSMTEETMAGRTPLLPKKFKHTNLTKNAGETGPKLNPKDQELRDSQTDQNKIRWKRNKTSGDYREGRKGMEEGTRKFTFEQTGLSSCRAWRRHGPAYCRSG